METRDPRPSPQGLVSQDDAGLWLKTDSNPVTDHTEIPSVTCGERPQDEPKVTPSAPAPALKPRYYGVMDDVGADYVFIPPPPPSYTAPSLPTAGSTDAMVNNPTVTLTNGGADAREAKANPSGLDWHHDERQLMAAHNKVNEVKASTAQTSMESMDTVSLSGDKDCTLPKDQDQTSMEGTGSLMETCYDPSGRHNQDSTTGDEESNVEHEDVVVLSGRQKNWSETDAEGDKYPKQVPSNTEKDKDVCDLAETDLKLTTENMDFVETNALTDFESCGPPELCKCNQNKTNQPQVPEVSNYDEGHVDNKSLDSNLPKDDWVRRESGTSKTQVSRLSISEGYEEIKGDQEDLSRKISTDIQQGEQLLQRLQQVQLRQDVESKSHTVEDEGAKTNLTEKERNEGKDVETIAMMSSSAMPVEPEHHIIARTEEGDSDDDQSNSSVPVDVSPINPLETSPTQTPFPSTRHRLSVTETSIERQIHEAANEKQNLQRAGGLFNLADNPDVLEIPFKTNISLEPLATMVGPDQRRDWQFSEQKMQKEISQEIQRELVLVNQGKIPGGYSKGEVRQLKETKLLFEAFQQDNTDGPTRQRKLPTSLMKDHVYPSVLERTRSLEMFSLKSRPISRAHSLRLYKSATSEMAKSPDDVRSRSPVGGSRDKTRLFPYPKQDKQTRLHRSMDSISADVSTSAVETRSKIREGNATQESPILRQNPFYKLRPALALQPEVEKDIREAKEREEELRRQRSSLYGENRQNSEDGEKSQPTLEPDVRRQSRGKLERVWPPPSKKDQQTQQEPKVHRAGGQKAPLWQRWESGLVNGQPSKENN